MINYSNVFDNMSQEDKDRLFKETAERVEQDIKDFLAEHFPPGWRKNLNFVSLQESEPLWGRGWIYAKRLVWCN